MCLKLNKYITNINITLKMENPSEITLPNLLGNACKIKWANKKYLSFKKLKRNIFFILNVNSNFCRIVVFGQFYVKIRRIKKYPRMFLAFISHSYTLFS